METYVEVTTSRSSDWLSLENPGSECPTLQSKLQEIGSEAAHHALAMCPICVGWRDRWSADELTPVGQVPNDKLILYASEGRLLGESMVSHFAIAKE
jgi:hypothetical protein